MRPILEEITACHARGATILVSRGLSSCIVLYCLFTAYRARRRGNRRRRCSARLGHSCLVLRSERRLGVIKRRRVAVALAPRELERHAPEPALVRGIDPIDAPDVAVGIENVEVVVVSLAAFAGDVGALQEEGAHPGPPFDSGEATGGGIPERCGETFLSPSGG